MSKFLNAAVFDMSQVNGHLPFSIGISINEPGSDLLISDFGAVPLSTSSSSYASVIAETINSSPNTMRDGSPVVASAAGHTLFVVFVRDDELYPTVGLTLVDAATTAELHHADVNDLGVYASREIPVNPQTNALLSFGLGVVAGRLMD